MLFFTLACKGESLTSNNYENRGVSLISHIKWGATSKNPKENYTHKYIHKFQKFYWSLLVLT